MTQKRSRVFYTKEYDAKRAALRRAKKSGFASIEEHRASIEAKRPELEAAKARNKAEQGRLLAKDRAALIPVEPTSNRVTVRCGRGGKPEVVADLPPAGYYTPQQRQAEPAKLALVEPPPPPPKVRPAPAPVSMEAGRQPKAFNRVTGRWEPITAIEAELHAGRRELDRKRASLRPNAVVGPVMGVWDFAQAIQDAKRRADIEADNLERYF